MLSFPANVVTAAMDVTSEVVIAVLFWAVVLFEVLLEEIVELVLVELMV